MANQIRQNEGSIFLSVPAEISEPTPLTGTLTPGTFVAEGFGFPVQFQVGTVAMNAKGRTAKLEITHLELGTRHESGSRWEVAPPIRLDALSQAALLRLAIQASRCVGMAFPPGWAVDMAHRPLGRLKVGDSIPRTPAVIYGCRIKQGVVTELQGPEIVLWDAGEATGLPHSVVRDLLGQRPAGRQRSAGSMTDPKVLKRVAALYRRAEKEGTGGISKPEWVRQQLATGDSPIHQSESWVRAVAVRARKAGLLETGKRKARK